MIELTSQPLDPDKFTTAVRRSTNGAIVTFLGTTRDNFEGKGVLTLEYESYDEMAVKTTGGGAPGTDGRVWTGRRLPSATGRAPWPSARLVWWWPSVHPIARRGSTPATRP